MRYLIAILVFTAGNVVADTCTISGNTTTCSDGSRYMQHGSTITVTPGERNMGGDVNVRYSGGAVDAGLRTIADVYGNKLRYDSEMYTQRMHDQGQRRALEQQESEFGRTYKLDQDRTAATIAAQEAAAENSRQQTNIAREQMRGTLDNQRYGVDQNTAVQKWLNENESAAARNKRADEMMLERERQEAATRGSWDEQQYQHSQRLSATAKGLRDMQVAYKDNPMERRNAEVRALRQFSGDTAVAQNYFGRDAQGLEFHTTEDGRYIPVGTIGGKQYALAPNGARVAYDPKTPGAYAAFTAPQLADEADTLSGGFTSQMNAGAADAAYTKRVQEGVAADAAAVQAKPAVQIAAQKAEQERLAAADALATQQKARRDNALAKITESSNAAITDLNNQNRALTSSAPGRIGSALGLQSAAGITRQDEKDYRRVKQLPDDAAVTQGQIIEHAVRTQLPGVLQNPQMVDVLRQSGIAVPDGPFEDWTPEQQASVGGQVTRAMYGIVQQRGLRALHDGIDLGDIPAPAIQKPGTMAAPEPDVYRADGLGSAVANWWERL